MTGQLLGILIRILVVAWFGIGFVLAEVGQAQEEKAEAGPGLGYVLVPKAARRIKVVLTVEMKAPNLLADEWSVFVSQIPELPGQVEARTTLIPGGVVIRERSDEARPMVVSQMPSPDGQWRRGVKARAEYEAILIERRLERREPGDPEPPRIAPLDPRTRRLLLSSGHQFDHNSPKFKAWLDDNKLRRERSESEVDFARKVFLAVKQGFTHSEKADVEHAASKVCEAGKSDFMGLTAVFVGALRANGIPTRVLAGRMVLLNGQATKFAWPHAKTEFYATGLGWVPADPAGAIRSGTKTEGLEFFGNDSGGFLTQHVDTDILIDTYVGTRMHEWMMDPGLWMSGGGNFNGSTTKVDVTVEAQELELAEVLARLNTRPGSTKKQASKTAKKGG